MIDRWIAALQAVGLEPTDFDLADALWLASQIGPPRPPEAVPALDADETGTTPETGVVPPPPREGTAPPPPLPAGSELVLQGLAIDPDDERPLTAGRTFPVPAAEALPQGLEIGRALRPLMRPVPSRRHLELDEETTARRIAEQEVWVPVMRPAAERRFDLALVVEAGPSMILWRPTIAQLRLLLERQGAFRDVRMWTLAADPKRPGRVAIAPGGAGGTAGLLRPEALVVPGDERLILLAGDGLSPAWRDGSVFAALRVWGRHHPTAVVQMLPPRLWPGTGMDLPVVELRCPAGGVANTRLAVADPAVRRPRLRHRREPRPALPVPAVWLVPEAVARWARLAAGPEGARAPGLLVPADPLAGPLPEVAPAPPATREEAERLVRHFRAAAALPARELAGYLAAVPLSLPVMRHVQRAMLPESRPEHLAEVFLGGLLHRTTPEQPGVLDDDVRYEFLPFVRELLLSSVPADEVLQVMKSVSDFLFPAAGGDEPFDVRAFLANPDEVGRRPIADVARPFAAMAARALGRLGGRLARSGRLLGHRLAGTGGEEGGPGEFTVEDLRARIAAGQVLAVIGSGVSIATTHRDPRASWLGLLHDGVAFCERTVRNLPRGWGERMRGLIDSGDAEDRFSVSENIARRLQYPHGAGFLGWLRAAVGTLGVVAPGLIGALNELGIPLATTTYDDLIERVTGRPAVTWRDPEQVARVVRGEVAEVAHLYGYWGEPESIIVGLHTYEQVLGDADSLRAALREKPTLLFVGCGSVASDPFLMSFLRTAYTTDLHGVRHVHLVLDAEAAAFRARHQPEDRITVIPYGAGHDDLEPFLRRLIPPARLPEAPICFGREDEVEQLVGALLMRPGQHVEGVVTGTSGSRRFSSPVDPFLVHGGPGVGKSTVALATLHDRRVAERYGRRRYFVPCHWVSGREGLLASIAASLFGGTGPEPESRVFDRLAIAPAALVLDDADRSWDADPEGFLDVIARITAIPGVALLTTARGSLRIRDLPWQRLRIGPLTLEAARTAFLAAAGQPWLAADPRLDDLIRAVDGVPLAVTLLASLTQSETSLGPLLASLGPLWERWQSEGNAMLERSDGQTLEVVLEMQARLARVAEFVEVALRHPLLPDAAGRLVSLLSALPAGIAVGDSKALGIDAGVADLVRDLDFDDGDAARLRLLEIVRNPAARSSPPDPDILDRARAFYTRMAADLGPRVGPSGEDAALQRLDDEFRNVEAMLRLGLATADPRPAVEAALSLTPYFLSRESAPTKALDQAAEASQGLGDTELEIRCLRALGEVALKRHDSLGSWASWSRAWGIHRRGLDLRRPADRDITADPARTYAVVVGIEKYAEFQWNNDGPARGAAAFVRWLCGRGVPPANIRLFASPLPSNARDVQGMDLNIERATRKWIVRFFLEMLPKLRGDLLWIYWNGHGVIDQHQRRRLIFADATGRDFLSLDWDSLLTFLRCRTFAGLPQQIAIVDAPATFVPVSRDLPPPEVFPVGELNPRCRQFVLLGARMGEVAMVDRHRRGGVFSAAVLDELERSPEHPFPPDMQALAERLQALFASRRRGEKHPQDPIEWRGWDEGTSRRQEVRQGTRVSEVQLRELSDLLLQCATFSDADRRDMVRSILPDQGPDHGGVRALNPRADTEGIVRSCRDSGDLGELLAIVRFLEGPTAAMGRVADWVRKVRLLDS